MPWRRVGNTAVAIVFVGRLLFVWIGGRQRGVVMERSSRLSCGSLHGCRSSNRRSSRSSSTSWKQQRSLQIRLHPIPVSSPSNQCSQSLFFSNAQPPLSSRGGKTRVCCAEPCGEGVRHSQVDFVSSTLGLAYRVLAKTTKRCRSCILVVV